MQSTSQLFSLQAQVASLKEKAKPQRVIEILKARFSELQSYLYDVVEQNYAALQNIQSFSNPESIQIMTAEQVLQVETEIAEKIKSIGDFTNVILVDEGPSDTPIHFLEHILRSLKSNEIKKPWFEECYLNRRDEVERGFKHFKAAGRLLEIGQSHKIYQEAGRGLELNSPGCIGDYGACISGGFGVPQDKAKAAELYKKAASLGNLTALVNLALMHRKGEGVRKDVEMAEFYLKLAAERGSVYALKILGNFSLEKNQNRDALFYYKLALYGADPCHLKKNITKLEHESSQQLNHIDRLTDLD